MGTLTDTPHAPGTRISVANCRCPDCTIARALSGFATDAWVAAKEREAGMTIPLLRRGRASTPAWADRWIGRTNKGAGSKPRRAATYRPIGFAGRRFLALP